MKKSLTMLLAILATLAMAISVAAEDGSLVTESTLELGADTSYSDEQKEEPGCKPNCEAGISYDDEEDY